MNASTQPKPTEKVHSLIDQGASKANTGAQTVVDLTARSAHLAVDKTADLAGQAQTQYVAAKKQVRAQVHAKPAHALAIAAGVGVIVGLLASRRRISKD